MKTTLKMKRYIIGLLVVFSHLAVFSQVTQLDYDFGGGSHPFAIVNADDGNPSYNLSVDTGFLNVEVDKKTQDYSFLGIFGLNLDLSGLPSVQFLVQSDSAMSFNIRLKSDSINGNGKETVLVTHSIVPSGNAEYVYLDLSSAMASKPEFNSSLVNEIQCEFTRGWNDSTKASVLIDYIRFGYAEQLPFGGTGFIQDFNSGMPVGLSNTASVTLGVPGTSLEVDVDKNQRWAGFEYNLGATFDVSGSPYLNMKVKTDKDFVMQVFLVDENNNGYQVKSVGSQYNYDELVNGKYYFDQNRVYKGGEHVNMLFDFTNAPGTVVDLSKISKIMIVPNGTALTFEGSFSIDEIALGDSALKMAYMGHLGELSFYRNSGPRTIIIPEIRDAQEVVVSGADDLMQNISVDAISYIQRNENQRVRTYGYSYLNLEPRLDSIGTDTLEFRVVGQSGYLDNYVHVPVTVAGNMPPLFDVPDSLVISMGNNYETALANVSDGDINAEQALDWYAYCKDKAIIDTIMVDYVQGNRNAVLSYSPFGIGKDTIIIKLADDEGAETIKKIPVSCYSALNVPPGLDLPEDQTVYNDGITDTLVIQGVTDGEGFTQNISFLASSSDTNLVATPQVIYIQGETNAKLVFTPKHGVTGTTNITLVVADDGGNVSNNGNQQSVFPFDMELIDPPVTGYKVDLTDPQVLDYFNPEKEGITYFLSVVDTLGGKALKVRFVDKWTYGGIWMDLPLEMDLTDAPVVSMEILSLGKSTWHWNYLYDPDTRNIENVDGHTFEIAPGGFEPVTFDYRQPGDMNDSEGKSINTARIQALLLNMHDASPSWPFTDASGVVYFRNIRFGDSAIFDPVTPMATLADIPGQSVFAGSGTHQVQLTGISDGNGNTAGVGLATSVSNSSIVTNVSVSPVGTEGTSTLEFTVGDVSGSATVMVDVTAPGADQFSESFTVNVLAEEATLLGSITIDASSRHQVTRGFGSFYNEPRWTGLYTDSLGCSAIRIGIISNQWEPVNDNDDPDVINLQGFNYDVFDWDYLRDLKDRGVETFILTSWSPPAWMKHNLSLDHKGQAVDWALTDNILEPFYYEEFAESMLAMAMAFKDEVGIDLAGIGLQNEPYFNEPYASAILNDTLFAQLVEITANKFAQAGMDHVKFYLPEQVFGFSWAKNYALEDYIEAVRANPVADENTLAFAVHGYDETGITTGFPDYSGWSNYWSQTNSGTYPKELWMSETHVGYESYNSSISLAGAIHGALWAGNISLWTNWAFGDMQLTNNVPNYSFYTSMNYFKFIRPGAVRLKTTTQDENLLATAFQNPDSSIVTVIINKGSAPVSTRIKGNSVPSVYSLHQTTLHRKCAYTGEHDISAGSIILPAKSVTTMIADKLPVLTIHQVEDFQVFKNAADTAITVTGISDGNGSTTGLDLTYTVSNPGLFSQVNLGAINSSGEADMSFSFAPDQLGSALINLLLSDGNGQVVHTSFVVSVVEEPVLESVEEYRDEVLVFPVPTSGYLNINMAGVPYHSFMVTDLSGRGVLAGKLEHGQEAIDVSGLNTGTYILRLSSGKENRAVKFTVY